MREKLNFSLHWIEALLEETMISLSKIVKSVLAIDPEKVRID
jgi:hypothetical protein